MALRSYFSFLEGTWGRALFLGLLAFALIAPSSFFKPSNNTLENYALDRCYCLQNNLENYAQQWFSGHHPPVPQSKKPFFVTIVTIDETSLDELEKTSQIKWPWPRRLHGELVQRLNEAGASLIVFDIVFDSKDPEDDRLFAKAIREGGNVILGSTMEIKDETQVRRRVVVEPTEELRRAPPLGIGLALKTPDPGMLIRRFYPKLLDDPCLFEVVMEKLNKEIPPTPGLIDFAYLDRLSYLEVRNSSASTLAPYVRDRVVLVGLTKDDIFFTPLSPATGQKATGVEIHGYIIQTLLQGRWGRELHNPARLIIYLMVTLLFSLVIARLSPWSALGVLAGFVFLILGSSFLIFWQKNLWVPPVWLTLGIVFIYLAQLFAQFFLAYRDKLRLRHAFSHYVSDAVVEGIITNPDQLKLGGEEKEVTVLFADLVGFSSFSEDRSPEALVGLLHDYFSAMTDVILAFQGTIDKYIGDALMAFWGAPLPQDNHALLACHAALEMERVHRKLQQAWQAKGWPLLSDRVGIHSGTVIAGNVGSQARFNYTVMGDAVNLAFRLEKANRQYGTDIIISETTHQHLGNHFLLRELDLVQVKGRVQPVTIFELLGPLPPSGIPTWLEIFNYGRSAYLKRQWRQAIDCFQKVLDIIEDDPPTKFYLKRCFNYYQKPPPKSWDGVTILDKT